MESMFAAICSHRKMRRTRALEQASERVRDIESNCPHSMRDKCSTENFAHKNPREPNENWTEDGWLSPGCGTPFAIDFGEILKEKERGCTQCERNIAEMAGGRSRRDK